MIPLLKMPRILPSSPTTKLFNLPGALPSWRVAARKAFCSARPDTFLKSMLNCNGEMLGTPWRLMAIVSLVEVTKLPLPSNLINPVPTAIPVLPVTLLSLLSAYQR